MSSIDTLVQEEPCVLYTIRYQIYRGLTHNEYFGGTLIWYHTQIKTYNTNTRAKRLTHSYKYISKSPVMCSQQLSVFHWITNCWYQKSTSEISSLSLLFNNYPLVEITYLLSRFSKTKFFLWDTKNTDKIV